MSIKLQSTLFALTLAFFGIFVAGCSNNASSGAVSSPQPAPSAAPLSDSDKPTTIYRAAKSSDERARADANGLVAVDAGITSRSASPARDAIVSLISQQGSPIPAGATLRSLKISERGTATVDFSKEFVENFQGGDEAAAQVVDSVVATLGQFDTIKRVQFLVAGKKVTDFAGAIDLSQPLPVVRHRAKHSEPAAASQSDSKGAL
jgi:hypothetical protein